MYLEDGDYEQSIELFEQLTAMAGYTDMAEDYHNAGIAYQELEQFGQAASFYRQTLEIDESFERGNHCHSQPLGHSTVGVWRGRSRASGGILAGRRCLFACRRRRGCGPHADGVPHGGRHFLRAEMDRGREHPGHLQLPWADDQRHDHSSAAAVGRQEYLLKPATVFAALPAFSLQPNCTWRLLIYWLRDNQEWLRSRRS